jgi:hypothetical protein
MKFFNFRTMAIAVAGLLSASNISAQMVGGSVFLKGNYVEAGICDNGDFGAASPPAGYHPHTTSTTGGALGFVADPAMDGWTVGTPAYMGDYFTPGTPFEGWNLQIGGIRAQAHTCLGFTGTGLTGHNVSYAAVGSKVIGTWEGTFDSMTVRQVTTLDTLGLYFTMKITLINTASVPKNDIYYLRSVDPDNNQSWPGGAFGTNNNILTGGQIVRATSSVGAASYLSLGTNDTNAQAVIYNSWPISSTTDLSTIFTGTFAGFTDYAAHNGDIAIGLAFRVAHLAPVDSASDSVAYKTTEYVHLRPANQKTFAYFYAFSQEGQDSAIADLWSDTLNYTTVTPPPPPPPTVVNDINAGGLIKAYPNPAGNVLYVSGLTGTDKLDLLDMMGRTMNTEWSVDDKNVNTYQLQQIPAGNYILIAKDANGRLKARIPLRKQ